MIRYLVTWLALVALAALSLALSRLGLGASYLAVALTIAAAQATLAGVVLMGLGRARLSIVMVPFAVVFFIALLAGLTALDVATRRTFPKAPSPLVTPGEEG